MKKRSGAFVDRASREILYSEKEAWGPLGLYLYRCTTRG